MTFSSRRFLFVTDKLKKKKNYAYCLFMKLIFFLGFVFINGRCNSIRQMLIIIRRLFELRGKSFVTFVRYCLKKKNKEKKERVTSHNSEIYDNWTAARKKKRKNGIYTLSQESKKNKAETSRFSFFLFCFVLGTIHERFNGKGYYYSWADPRTNGQEVDWLAGRNFCRQRCMDLVSLETSAENEFIKSRIVQSTHIVLIYIYLRSNNV